MLFKLWARFWISVGQFCIAIPLYTAMYIVPFLKVLVPIGVVALAGYGLYRAFGG